MVSCLASARLPAVLHDRKINHCGFAAEMRAQVSRQQPVKCSGRPGRTQIGVDPGPRRRAQVDSGVPQHIPV